MEQTTSSESEERQGLIRRVGSELLGPYDDILDFDDAYEGFYPPKAEAWAALAEALKQIVIRVRSAEDVAFVQEWLRSDNDLKKIELVNKQTMGVPPEVRTALDNVRVICDEKLRENKSQNTPGVLPVADANGFLDRLARYTCDYKWDERPKDISRGSNFPRRGEVLSTIPAGVAEAHQRYTGRRIYELLHEINMSASRSYVPHAHRNDVIENIPKPRDFSDPKNYARWVLNQGWHLYQYPPALIEALRENGTHEMKQVYDGREATPREGVLKGLGIQKGDIFVTLIWRKMQDNTWHLGKQNMASDPMKHGPRHLSLRQAESAAHEWNISPFSHHHHFSDQMNIVGAKFSLPPEDRDEPGQMIKERVNLVPAVNMIMSDYFRDRDVLIEEAGKIALMRFEVQQKEFPGGQGLTVWGIQQESGYHKRTPHDKIANSLPFYPLAGARWERKDDEDGSSLKLDQRLAYQIFKVAPR